MSKYKAIVSFDLIQETANWTARGCAQYSFFNAGNVNVTIDGAIVLKPRETFKGPDMHPDVGYDSKHKIEFDAVNAAVASTPVGGVKPPVNVVVPNPDRDPRLIIIKSNIQ
ncbi:MAG: hypothetical protein ACOYKE_02430 [Ferruginibacter sp.]